MYFEYFREIHLMWLNHIVFGFTIDFHMPFIYKDSGQLVLDMTKWDVALYIDFHNALIHAKYWATLMFTAGNVLESGVVALFA